MIDSGLLATFFECLDIRSGIGPMHYRQGDVWLWLAVGLSGGEVTSPRSKGSVLIPPSWLRSQLVFAEEAVDGGSPFELGYAAKELFQEVVESGQVPVPLEYVNGLYDRWVER